MADSSRGTYWITTFGCQMNKADSERMAGILESMGYREAEAELEADLVLYNTCTIREKPDEKLAAHKQPRFVAIVEELPHTPSHRVAKWRLKDDQALRARAVEI